MAGIAARGGPQDGLVWHSPEVAREVGGVHDNSVLFYFARSPFFDQTSNNASAEVQASFNPQMHQILSTRATFEEHLSKLQGLEYVVSSAPRDYGPDAVIGRGTWVINKRDRRRGRLGADEVTVLATYYVVGISICESSSVGDVLLQKMLSATLNLNKLFSIASTTSTYTPALDRSYFASIHQTQSARGSSQAPPSKENTPMPLSDSQKPVESVNVHASAPQSSTASTTANDNYTLNESFDRFIRYNHEYMDENPLVGEPGSFVFSSSKLSVQHQAAQRAQQEKELEQQQQRVSAKQAANELIQSPTAPPNGAAADKSESVPAKKGSFSGMQKPKRRKSKAPTTPGSPPSPTTT